MRRRAARAGRARRLSLSSFSALCALSALCAACKGTPDPIQQMAEVADSADQLMIGLTMHMTNLGVRQAILEADTAFVYENTGITELKRVKLTFFSETGVQTSVLNANEGTYRGRQATMEGRGRVVVLRQDGARLTTEYLRYEQAKNEVSTDSAYTFIQGDRRGEGVGFVSDPSFRDLRTQNVTGRSGGGFRLPQ